MRKLIVDGYNLIFCYYDKDELVGHELEQVRNEAIADLREYAARHPTVDVVAVFDGQEDSIKRGRGKGKLTVVFVRGGPQAADRYIKRMLSESDKPQECRIVTSDVELRDHARGMRAAVVESVVFADKLGLRPHRRRPRPSEKPRDAEDSDWIRYIRQCARFGPDTHVPPRTTTEQPIQKGQPSYRLLQTPAVPRGPSSLRVSYLSGSAVLRWFGLSSGNFVLEVHDANGRRIWVQRVAGPSGTQEITNLRPGVYTVYLKGERGDSLAGRIRIKKPADGWSGKA